MKTLRLLFAVFGFVASAHAVDVQWYFSDFTATPQTVRRVYITPLSTPTTSGNYIVVGDRRTFTNDASGSLIVSNLVVGSTLKEFFRLLLGEVVTRQRVSLQEVTEFYMVNLLSEFAQVEKV
mgnify:CR=1 FL=1